MKLTYWYSKCPHDSDVYSVRARTRREALESIKQSYRSEGYEAPVKVTVEYTSSFDLMQQCSEEGHHYWEIIYQT